MTDDPLDKLQSALKRQTPAPSDAARQAAVQAAMENFSAQSQGSAETLRPTSDRPEKRAGIWTGVMTMLSRITQPRMLMGTSALATLALAFVLTQNMGRDYTQPYAPGQEDQATSNLKPEGRLTITPGPEVRPEALPSAQPNEATVLEDSIAETERSVRAEPVPPQVDLRFSREESEAGAIANELARSRSDAEQGLGARPSEARENFRQLSADGAPSSAEAQEPLDNDPPALEQDAILGGLTGLAEQRLNVVPPGAAAKRAQPNPAQNPVFVVPPQPAPTPEALPIAPETSTEAFPDAEPNSLKVTLEEPVSTFSIDVDTASYALVRQSLNSGSLPPPQAVRIEEMINYFDYSYPMPESSEAPFRTSVSIAETPWNPDTQLMHIGIQGYDLAMDERPPLNLVFLIDTSGSMNDPNKLPLLINSFRLLLGALSDEDRIAIVTYAGSAGMVLEPTPAAERATILRALDALSAGGSTAGQAGLQQAYALAEQMHDDGDVSRVILATDGDFNVGISDPDALKTFIADKRESGTYLSVLGFGRGNYQDATMQALAQNGNGAAAYIDTLAEAHKVLVEDVTGSLFSIANDVKIQVEFNPAQISEYRLLGYETRALRREDFNNDAIDAGEIGAGHQVTAIYEITPKGSPAERVSDLRYTAPTEVTAGQSAEYAFLKLRYKRPGEDRSNLVETAILPDRADIAASETQFAAAVAGFGMLLRGGREITGWGYDDARALAAAARGDDPYGYRSEAVNLMRLASAYR